MANQKDVDNSKQIAEAAKAAAISAKERAAYEKDIADYQDKSLRASLSARGISKDQYLDSQKRAREEDEITRQKKEQAKIARTTVGLTAKLNKLLDSGAGSVLKQYNLTKSLEAANKGAQVSKGEEQRGYNLVQEAQAAAVQEMKDGTFKAADFLNNLEEQFEGMSEEAQKAFNEMGPSLREFAKEGEKAGKSLENALNIDAKSLDGLEEMRNKAKEISGILSSKKLMGAAALGLAVKFATDFASKALEIRQSLGTSAIESARIAGNMKAAGAAAKVFGGNAQEAEAAIMGMTEEFGNLNLLTAGTSIELGKMVANTGLTGANAAKLLKSMDAMSSASIETNIAMINTVRELAAAEGVAPAQVLNDMASDTELFAKYGGAGAKNLGKAAIQARKLGLNLSTVAGIAESLLDFETSIASEMEASMLLGRGINLEKARQLAYDEDLEGLQKEVLKLVGSQAEFAKMERMQKEALAKAVGVTVGDLGKLVAGEKTSAEVQEQKAETQRKQMDMQQIMMGTMVGMHAIELAILAAKGAQALYDRKDISRLGIRIAGRAKIFGLSLGSMIATLGASIIGIAAIGGLLALAHAAVSKGSSVGMVDGGMVGRDGGKIAASDTIPTMLTPGEIVLNAGQQKNVAGSIGGEPKQLIALQKKTNELLNTLIRKTGEQALAS